MSHIILSWLEYTNYDFWNVEIRNKVFLKGYKILWQFFVFMGPNHVYGSWKKEIRKLVVKLLHQELNLHGPPIDPFAYELTTLVLIEEVIHDTSFFYIKFCKRLY